MGKRGLFALALAATALAARAQVDAGLEPGGEDRRDAASAAPEGVSDPGDVAGGTSAVMGDTLERACLDLLRGRAPQGSRLEDACADLVASRAEAERARLREAQAVAAPPPPGEAQGSRPQAVVAPPPPPGEAQGSRGSAPVQEGEGVRASFGQAASELTGRGRTQAMGFRQGGPVGSTLVTNPIGWFSGLGVNVELFQAFEPKLSWVAGARYSSTDASNGEARTFGAMAGVDWFVFGRNNEGLRIGPRLEVAAGREEFQGDTTFARLGLGGEFGYIFIATNGLTAIVGGGMGGRIAGDDENEDFASFVGGELGPYLKLGLGYSW